MKYKRVGEAATSAETAIEEAVSRVEEWSGHEVWYRPVLGGISNTNWQICLDTNETFFVKIPGRGTAMFVDRMAAHDASIKAGACGVSAKVRYFVEDLGVEVFEFLDGYRTSSNADFHDPQIRRNTVLALRHFHQQPGLVLTKTIFDQIDQHLQQISELGGHVPQDAVWVKRQYELARNALDASGMDVAPCLNDNLAGNFMVGETNDVILVDFEYSSNNDPYYDLALLFGEMFFEPSVEREMIDAYFGRVDAKALARVYVYRALADIKWSNWAWVQNQVSELEFDFHKYGVWKHMRARQLMQDPRWIDALQHV